MNLQFKGPFAFLPLGEGRSIFEQPDAAMPGVCLWTVRAGADYWAHFVGTSKTSIVQRTAKNFREFFKGEYTVYDGDAFKRLEKKPVYKGNSNPVEFRRRFGEISKHLAAMLGTYQLFYAVLHTDKQTLERIEAALILKLQTSERAKLFLDNHQPGNAGTTRMDLNITWPQGCAVAGL